jgi:magnesium transporter
VITVNVHTKGKVLENGIPLAEISEVLKRPSEMLWIDVLTPSAEDLRLIQDEFGFHDLAMEDVSRQSQRPKIEIYDDYIVIIFYALLPGKESTETATMEQLGMFVGSNYVVTVHDQVIPVLDETSARWCANVEQLGESNIALLVYSILDAIVDGYFPIVDGISDRLDELENQIFTQFSVASQQEIFRIKKELVTIRRVVAPERDVMNVILRREMPIFDTPVLVYFQDLYDHILRVTDAVDTYRDLLSSALDYHLAVTSNRLNQVMKTLTASSIILMSMTLVASVYGMNFIHMPELAWHYGYAYALGLMAAIGFTIFRIFRRIDWL